MIFDYKDSFFKVNDLKLMWRLHVINSKIFIKEL